MELTIEQALQQGVAAHKEGKLQEAENLYRSILSVDPQHSDANHNLGVLAVGVGKVEEALPFFKVALEKDHKQGQYWLSYIDAFIRLGQLDNARSVLEQGRSIGLNGDQVDQLEKQLGNKIITHPSSEENTNSPSQQQIDDLVALYSQSNFKEALSDGNRLAKQFPTNHIIPNILGAIYAGLSQYEKAIMSFNKVIELKPNFAGAYSNIGVALLELGKHREAITHYKKAIELKPDYAEVYYNLAVAFNDLGQHEEAITSCSKAIELKPDYAEAYYNFGNALNGLGKYEEAITHYNKAIELKPDYSEAHNNLGNMLGGHGKSEGAIDSYNKAIELRPDYAEAYNNMGIVLNELGKHEDAIAHYNKAIELKPDYVKPYSNLGNVLNELGKHEEASVILGKAIDLEPTLAEPYNNLGNILFKCKHFAKAIIHYEKAIELMPEYTVAYNNLGNALNELGKYEKAINSYNKAIELKPDYAEAYNNLGNVLHEFGNYKEAITNYNKAIKIQPDLKGAWTNIDRPLSVLKIFDSSVDAYISAIPKVSSSLSANRELAVLNYKLNRSNPEKNISFDALKTIMKEAPNLSVKNPHVNDIDVAPPSHTMLNKIFALKHFGRSGTGFLHSLIDNHKNISTLPSIYFSEFFNHVTWDKITAGGWSELVDRFIRVYPVLFDARAPEPVLSIGETKLYGLGIKEGMANVGENRDEYLSVDKESFRASLIQHLSFFNNIDAYTFFKLIHIAYEETRLSNNRKEAIFYHIHNPDIYAKLNFVNLAPHGRWVVMVREPVQSCESWIRSNFNENNYKAVSSQISSMLFDIDDFIFQKQDCIGVRLEDLIQEPEKTVRALCRWMGIKEEPSLYEMTAQGKKWWGDPSSPDFGKNGQRAFDSSSVNRKIGTVFSKKDQFLLKTLFYPFRVRFNYIGQDTAKFKSDLEKIRPMIDQMFDFEETMADRLKIDQKDFIKSGFYLDLRSSMVERWETLNKFNTYPDMLKPIKI